MQPSSTSYRAGKGVLALLLLIAPGGAVPAAEKPGPAPPPPASLDRAKLQAELKATQQQLQTARQSLSGLQAELAAARKQLAEAVRARDAARKARDVALKAHDAALKVRDAAQKARDALARDLEAERATKTAKAGKLPELERELTAARTRLSAVQAELGKSRTHLMDAMTSVPLGGRARFLVEVPSPDTRLYIDGKLHEGDAGKVIREFVTARLTPGDRYVLDLRVKTVRDGKPVEARKQVIFYPDNEVRLSFPGPAVVREAAESIAAPAR